MTSTRMFVRDVGAWPGRHPVGRTTAWALIISPVILGLGHSTGTHKRQRLAFFQQIICLLFWLDL